MKLIKKIITESYRITFILMLIGGIVGTPALMSGRKAMNLQESVLMSVLTIIIAVVGLLSVNNLTKYKLSKAILITLNSMFSLLFVYCLVMVFRDIAGFLFRNTLETTYFIVLLILISVPQLFTVGLVKLFPKPINAKI